MSHDRILDEIMEIDINPEGPYVDHREAQFRNQFLGESEEAFRLDAIDEGAVHFRFNEGDHVRVQDTPVVIKECRGYKQGHTVVPRYLVEATDGRQAEVGEAQISEANLVMPGEEQRPLDGLLIIFDEESAELKFQASDASVLPDVIFSKPIKFTKDKGGRVAIGKIRG